MVPGDLGDPNGGRKDLVARTEAALARCTDEPDRLTGRVACSLQLLTDLAAVIARQEANMAPCE